MAFPVRATMADVEAVCSYLLSKPTGATHAEARAVLDAGTIDPEDPGNENLGLIDEDADSGKMRLTDRGRAVARDKGARRVKPLRDAVWSIEGYRNVVERAKFSGELTVAASEVAAYWHQHFRDEASDSDEVINQQAICFFQLLEGADLGRLIVGRKGAPTRFEFHEANVAAFADTEGSADEARVEQRPSEAAAKPSAAGKRVFISYTNNKKILEQIKRTVASLGFEPVVFEEIVPFDDSPADVFKALQTCIAGVIHVGFDRKAGKERLEPNVLVEIGAAVARFGSRLVLVVEHGVELPSNVKGLNETRYTGDSLDWDAGIKMLEALGGLKAER